MTEYSNMTEQELELAFKQVESALMEKREFKIKDAMRQIEEIADSIDMIVTMNPKHQKSPAVKSRAPIKPKYIDPITQKTWTGRGVAPLWIKAYMNSGRDKEEFSVNKL